MNVVVSREPVKVTFNENYEGGKETTLSSDKDGKVIPTTDPQREGCKFLDWFKDANGEGEAIDFTTEVFAEDTTLYAKWEKIPAKVSFNYQAEGFEAKVVQANKEGKVTSPAEPTRKGYKFLG